MSYEPIAIEQTLQLKAYADYHLRKDVISNLLLCMKELSDIIPDSCDIDNISDDILQRLAELEVTIAEMKHLYRIDLGELDRMKFDIIYGQYEDEAQ